MTPGRKAFSERAVFGWNSLATNLPRLTLGLDRLRDAAITARPSNWRPARSGAQLAIHLHRPLLEARSQTPAMASKTPITARQFTRSPYTATPSGNRASVVAAKTVSAPVLTGSP